MNTKEELISKKETFLQLKEEYSSYENQLINLNKKQTDFEQKIEEFHTKIHNIEEEFRSKSASYYKRRHDHNIGLKRLVFTLLIIVILISMLIPNALLYTILSLFNNISLGYVGNSLLEAFSLCFFSFSPFVTLFSCFSFKRLDKLDDKILNKLNYKFDNDKNNIERLNEIEELQKELDSVSEELYILKNVKKNDMNTIQKITNKMNEIKNKLYDVMYADYEEVINYSESLLEETGTTLALK